VSPGRQLTDRGIITGHKPMNPAAHLPFHRQGQMRRAIPAGPAASLTLPVRLVSNAAAALAISVCRCSLVAAHSQP